MFADVKITGSYGTFEVSKIVTVVCPQDMTHDEILEEAWPHTGIAADLARGGWSVSEIDGEEWEFDVAIRPTADR